MRPGPQTDPAERLRAFEQKWLDTPEMHLDTSVLTERLAGALFEPTPVGETQQRSCAVEVPGDLPLPRLLAAPRKRKVRTPAAPNKHKNNSLHLKSYVTLIGTTLTIGVAFLFVMNLHQTTKANSIVRSAGLNVNKPVNLETPHETGLLFQADVERFALAASFESASVSPHALQPIQATALRGQDLGDRTSPKHHDTGALPVTTGRFDFGLDTNQLKLAAASLQAAGIRQVAVTEPEAKRTEPKRQGDVDTPERPANAIEQSVAQKPSQMARTAAGARPQTTTQRPQRRSQTRRKQIARAIAASSHQRSSLGRTLAPARSAPPNAAKPGAAPPPPAPVANRAWNAKMPAWGQAAFFGNR